MAANQAATVIALGGNAISPANEAASIAAQFARTRQTAALLAGIVAQGVRIVLTHGNGPQVGAALRRVELAAELEYRLPLDVCVADTQGGMGYMIALCMNEALAQRGLQTRFAAIVTSVQVDPSDPAFANPTKPIGPHFDAARRAEAARLGWTTLEISPGRFRRGVPSPRPLCVNEIEFIRRLVDAGSGCVVGGGGGVPVVRDAGGALRGVEGVVDKDWTSALIAAELCAARVVFATDVPQVCLDFGTAHARSLDRLTTREARQWLEFGQFPAGSMGPKIEAALMFLERSTAPAPAAIICSIEQLADALAGRAGTRIVPER